MNAITNSLTSLFNVCCTCVYMDQTVFLIKNKDQETLRWLETKCHIAKVFTFFGYILNIFAAIVLVTATKRHASILPVACIVTYTDTHEKKCIPLIMSTNIKCSCRIRCKTYESKSLTGKMKDEQQLSCTFLSQCTTTYSAKLLISVLNLWKSLQMTFKRFRDNSKKKWWEQSSLCKDCNYYELQNSPRPCKDCNFYELSNLPRPFPRALTCDLRYHSGHQESYGSHRGRLPFVPRWMCSDQTR